MAHIQKRKRGGEVRYYVRWRIDGREKVRSFARARDAETFPRQVENDQVVGLQVDPSRGAVTLGAYAEEWL